MPIPTIRPGPTSSMTSEDFSAAAEGCFDDLRDAVVAMNEINGAVMVVQCQRANGTANGSASAATWNTVEFNTVVIDGISDSDISVNTIDLPSGTYDIEASAPANSVQGHRLRLTGMGGPYYGTSEYAASGVQTRSFLSARVVLTVDSNISLQHYTTLAIPTNGLGVPVSAGVIEVYADIKIRKV